MEILKILLDPQTRVMIFDEPTSVLAPHEVQAFLQMLSGFRDKGYGIFLITHKIDEILAVSDRITIRVRANMSVPSNAETASASSRSSRQ